jgi:hypothetical protein
VADNELLVTDALAPGEFDTRRVEHLITGASDAYVRTRSEIAGRYYHLSQPSPRVVPEAANGQPEQESERAQRWGKLGWEVR